MANKSRQNQSAQRQITDYEREKLLRVEENNKKLEAMGLKRIANSLVDSQMKKKKVKPPYNNVRDVDYIPDNGDDSEEDHQEVNKSVKVSKKQHLPQYIAPLSMNRIANLARKNRMTASKASKAFPLDLNAMKENQRRSTITMGDLISRTQRELVNNKKATPNCIKGRSKGRSLLVDEDDYEDDGMFQDCLETDEDEGDIMRSQDEADQDKEYEDMEDMTIANNENDIETNDISEDLEEEDDVHRLEIEQQQHPELEKAIGLI
ncbi:hypothetical protein Hanom_Chr01g00026241 [Helianthus anomalus]